MRDQVIALRRVAVLKFVLQSLMLSLILSGVSTVAHSYSVSSGNLEIIKSFESSYMTPRTVRIWTPDHYSATAADGKKFAVVYMHDGQMLFDASITWNKQEWGVDEVAAKLMEQGRVKDFIVVGVDNGGATMRSKEYFPQAPFSALREASPENLNLAMPANSHFVSPDDRVLSDAYLKFLVEELKPYIDENYSVLTDKSNTAIMGSSMGGLISLYAISEYPETFGAAACLSTHWPGAMDPPDNPIPDAFFNYMRDALPKPSENRIYFDHGTETLDTQYPKYQLIADGIMRQKGYDQSSWQTRVFPGAKHDENSWRARLDIPLTFLFGER